MALSRFFAVFGVLFAASAIAQQCRIVPLTPAQPAPKVEEGERATASETFRSSAFVLALSPSNLPHIFDTANRIRRVDANGRMMTIAGNGDRADTLSPGPALQSALPNVTMMLFSPAGMLHFVAVGQVFRIVDGNIEVVAGSGRPGFNGESGPADQVNLGGIVNIAFTRTGTLLIIDGYNRLRGLEPDGTLRTIAGSTRVAAAPGFTGDNGPGADAALSNPRQVFPLRDGSIWIKDLAGRHLRILTPDGIIRTINQNFEATVNIFGLPDGTPAAATANRLYPILPNGNIATGGNPYPPFTGTPLAIGSDGAMFFNGNERPGLRNPLVRLHNDQQTVVASAPTVSIVDGQAPPYAVVTRGNTLLYSTTLNGKSGIVEARPGQAARFIVGGGDDVGDAEGKTATNLAAYGILAFTIDGEGRIVSADVYRRRILLVGSDGKVSILKTSGGEQVVYAPLGTFSQLQRIAADNAGNIYWYNAGYTPTGGVFTAEVSVWTKATSAVSNFTIEGLAALSRLDDGSVAVLAGNSTNFRSAYPIAGGRPGAAFGSFRMLPITSVTRWRERPYFIAAARLFRGDPGKIEYFEATVLPQGSTAVPDFVMASTDSLLVHYNDGGVYRVENIDACKWTPQPAVASGGVVNAASFGYPNTISPRQLLTVFGTGLGPPGGQGIVLDGVMRAVGQPAPYPTLVLGNFSGAIPTATLTGATLPVVYSDNSQMTVQAAAGIPASGAYLLYFSWQGLQLIHPEPIRVEIATPALFTGSPDNLAVATNEDGSRHAGSNPAAPGSLVHLFGTGLGAVTGAVALGDFFSRENPPAVTNEVSVTIGEQPAAVEFAGGAPGMISSIYQITVRVPDSLPRGRHLVTVTVSGQSIPSAQQAFLAIQ